MWSTRYSRQSLTKLEFSRRIFEKILKYQISWISVQREPSCSMRAGSHTDWWTEGWTYMTKLIVAFRNHANSPKQDEGLESSYSGYGPVVGFCQDGDEPWGSVTGGDFTYWVAIYIFMFFFCISSFDFLCFSFVTYCLGVHTFCDAG
jgi:hypothetical protein